MRLPNGKLALVDERKLVEYCLSTSHPKGRRKARLFAAALGLTAVDAGYLRGALERAAETCEATPTRKNEFGQFFEVRFMCGGPKGTAELLSVWIIEQGDQIPRLVTVYPI